MQAGVLRSEDEPEEGTERGQKHPVAPNNSGIDSAENLHVWEKSVTQIIKLINCCDFKVKKRYK